MAGKKSELKTCQQKLFNLGNEEGKNIKKMNWASGIGRAISNSLT